ncbi:hypothetical protein LINGRAHAP2_LOCUS36286 [Linum grandiflorum]
MDRFCSLLEERREVASFEIRRGVVRRPLRPTLVFAQSLVQSYMLPFMGSILPAIGDT